MRTAGRFHREAVALAGQVGADWRDVILANISYDLAIATFGCSTVALPTAEGPVVARNMDWWPEDLLARASYLVRNVRGGRLLFANAGWPGAIGVVTGLSQNGFAVVLNAVVSSCGASRIGYPVLLHLRRVVEDAKSFEVALDWLSNQHLTTSGLFTLVGVNNEQRVVIERTPKQSAQRWAEADKPLFATNDYRLLFQPEERPEGEIYETTCHRYDALCRIFAEHRADRRVSDEELLFTLSDPNVIQGITAQHIIMRPRRARCGCSRHGGSSRRKRTKRRRPNGNIEGLALGCWLMWLKASDPSTTFCACFRS